MNNIMCLFLTYRNIAKPLRHLPRNPAAVAEGNLRVVEHR